MLLIITGIVFEYSCKKNATQAKPTEPVQPTLPGITTLPVSPVANNVAASGFSITNKDTTTITEKGIVWGTSSNPTIDLLTKASTEVDSTSYALNMGDLDCSTKYFVRAYAVTLSKDTLYGNELSFTMSSIADYEKHLILSKTAFTDTVIGKLFLDKMYPSAGASFLNRLSLHPGVYLYVKFDSAINLRCQNGYTTKYCYTGDTMNFGPIAPRGFESESAVIVSPVIDVANDPKSSGGNFQYM